MLQKHYGADDSQSKTAWYIPLTYTTQSQPDFTDTSTKDWLEPTGQPKAVALSDKGWVVFNLQQTGTFPHSSTT